MPAPRKAIVELCRKLLPDTTDRSKMVHWNQVGFDNLAKDYGQGQGTTCGFLPHWLLWRFGCTDTTLVNRSEPTEGHRYRIGENLSIFQPNGLKGVTRPSWTKIDKNNTMDLFKGVGPQPGDPIIIRGGLWKDKVTQERTLDSAHIMVLLEVVSTTPRNVKWRVAQSGNNNNAGEQAAHITTLEGRLEEGTTKEGNSDVPGPHLLFRADILGEESFQRRVTGYCNIDMLPWGAAPSSRLLSMIDERWSLPATNSNKKVDMWFGWYELANAGGFIQKDPTYILLHRGHEAFRLQRTLGPYFCVARGVWTLQGNIATVDWDDGTPKQSWSLAMSWVPKEAAIGTPMTGNTGKLTRIMKIQMPPKGVPPGVSPNWLVG